MHIHIPDGVLASWVWIIGLIVTLILVSFAILKLKKDPSKLPIVALLTAITLVVMSVPLGLPVHINLMILVGIITGVYWSLIVSFTSNVLLASFGHGGLTMIGLNTLVLWLQALAGIFLFLILRKLIKNKSFRAGISAFLATVISFLLVIGIVYASNLELDKFIDDHDKKYYIEKNYDQEDDHEEISLIVFLILTLPLVLWGAFAESVVTFFGVNYINKTRPDLLNE